MKIPVMMTSSLVLLIFSLAAPTASAAEGQTGVVYGDNHAFFVTAPSGWVLDNRSGLGNRVHAAFYPEGSNWRDSPAIMYANGVGRSSGETLDSFIAEDIQAFRGRSPQIQVDEGSPNKTKDGRVALVSTFRVINRAITKRWHISRRTGRLSCWLYRRDLRMPISVRCIRSRNWSGTIPSFQTILKTRSTTSISFN